MAANTTPERATMSFFFATRSIIMRARDDARSTISALATENSIPRFISLPPKKAIFKTLVV
jgi:hypothetical protein